LHSNATKQVKICFYMWDAVTRDSIESRQKGIVIIRSFGNIEKIVQLNKSMVTPEVLVFGPIMKRLLMSIPSRIEAIHTSGFIDTPAYRIVSKFLLTTIFWGELTNLRSRVVLGFEGSDLETRYKLNPYGIPIESIPLTDASGIKSKYHNQWIKTRRMLELDENEDEFNVTATAIVECPALNDVVFRTGSRKTPIQNPGNRLYRDMIQSFLKGGKGNKKTIPDAKGKFGTSYHKNPRIKVGSQTRYVSWY